MDGFEHSETVLSECQKAADELRTYMDIILERLQNALETLSEIFRKILQDDDVYGDGKNERVRNGSSIKRKSSKHGKTNVKWREKYRPP